MSVINNQKTKSHYNISEVARMLSIPASQIYFWEKTFALLTPKKNAVGDHLFTQKDIKNIQHIYQLIEEQGYTIAGAKAQLEAQHSQKTPDNRQEIVQTLKSIKGFLQVLKREL